MDVKIDVSESIIQIHSKQASQDELKNIKTHTNLTHRCILEDTNTVDSEPDDKEAIRAKFGLLGDLKRRERTTSSISYMVSPLSKKVFLDYAENPQTFHLYS